jgi:hypothetical protein
METKIIWNDILWTDNEIKTLIFINYSLIKNESFLRNVFDDLKY